MDKPATEQVKEFWEWCGLKEEIYSGLHVWYDAQNRHVHSGCEIPVPLPDLNNLFKYAVPKVRCVALTSHYNGWFEQDGYEASIMWDKMDNAKSVINKDPALALFWAIWEVIHEN